jgi:hypothetical protein
MDCISAFTQDGTIETAVFTSSQIALCTGTVTIPECSIPGKTQCAWYRTAGKAWSNSWSQSCWSTPSVLLWPSTDITGGVKLNTELTYSSPVAYTVSGSTSQIKTTTITIKSVTLSLTVGGITELHTIGTSISLTPSDDGNFTSSVQLDTINANLDGGYSYTITSVLYMCIAELDSGKPWLSVQSDVTINYDGYSSTTTLTMPIYATTP